MVQEEPLSLQTEAEVRGDTLRGLLTLEVVELALLSMATTALAAETTGATRLRAAEAERGYRPTAPLGIKADRVERITTAV